MDYTDEVMSLPAQVLSSAPFELERGYRHIVFSGMGGSGVVGRIASEFLSVPVVLVDDYSLPEYVGKEDLLISISYSGNTEETISVTQMALERGMDVVAITSGGRLSSMVRKVVKVPGGLQPRAALGYMLTPVLETFIGREFRKERVVEAMRSVEGRQEEIGGLAKEIVSGRLIPVIYGFSPFRAVAYRWKTQFNENAKIMAYSNYFPELNHNDTVPLKGTYRKEEFKFLVFWPPEDPRIGKRIEVTEQVTGSRFQRIEAISVDRVSRLFELIYYGDLLSLRVAHERKVDPRDVSVIEELKGRLL